MKVIAVLFGITSVPLTFATNPFLWKRSNQPEAEGVSPLTPREPVIEQWSVYDLDYGNAGERNTGPIENDLHRFHGLHYSHWKLFKYSVPGEPPKQPLKTVDIIGTRSLLEFKTTTIGGVAIMPYGGAIVPGKWKDDDTVAFAFHALYWGCTKSKQTNAAGEASAIEVVPCDLAIYGKDIETGETKAYTCKVDPEDERNRPDGYYGKWHCLIPEDAVLQTQRLHFGVAVKPNEKMDFSAITLHIDSPSYQLWIKLKKIGNDRTDPLYQKLHPWERR